MKSFLLTVVIPSYNEMANLQKGVLDKVEQYLKKKTYDFEVLIVDDGSNDGSLKFVQQFCEDNKRFRVIKNNHTGKAGAVTKGVLEAKGDYVLFTDMDQATPINELDKLIPFINQGGDIIIGSRSSRPGAPLSRKIMSKSAVLLRVLMVGMPKLKDTQCGFKLFTKKAAQDIFTQINKVHNGFRSIRGSSVTAGFDVEVLYIGKKMGYFIIEVPVEWLYVETRRVSPIKDSLDGLLDLIRIRINITRGIYF